jgi:hypothetical protein
MNRVRNEYNDAGWVATIEWADPSRRGGDERPKKLQLSLDYEAKKRLADKIVAERQIIPEKVVATAPMEQPPVMNVLEFVKHLGIELTPWQRIVLTAIYAGRRHNEKLRLDANQMRHVCVSRHANLGGVDAATQEALLARGTNQTRPQVETFAIFGRRGGKSMLEWLTCYYEAYSLMRTLNACDQYPLLRGNRVTIAHVSPSEMAAKNAIWERILATFHVENTVFYEAQITDKKIIIPAKAQDNLSGLEIVIECASVNAAPTLPTVKAAVLSEPEYAKAKEVHQHLRASMATFGQNALMLTFGSIVPPEERRDGKKRSWLEEEVIGAQLDGNSLGIRVPTWLANPKVPMEYLDKEFARSPEAFMYTYGAGCHDPSGGYLGSPT